MASRGHLGGLSWTTPQAMRVLDAAGCDVVLVETVGVGQSEVEVAGLADTTLVLRAPGAGDGADQLRRDLRSMIALGERPEGGWRPPIVKTVAHRGEGIADVVAEIDHH